MNAKHLLDQTTWFLENGDFGATPTDERAFDRVVRKYLGPSFKYEDYLSTGGGKSTADGIFKALQDKGADLEQVAKDLEPLKQPPQTKRMTLALPPSPKTGNRVLDRQLELLGVVVTARDLLQEGKADEALAHLNTAITNTNC